MADAPIHGALRHLHAWRQTQTLAEAPDAELLQRFTDGNEEAAFAVLLRRHGPMVLGVSRRILHRLQDAEDVFQATFLILARKAAAIRKRESVGSFLHGVAHRLAVRARAQGVRRQARERQAADMHGQGTNVEAAWQEVQAALDAALEDLPEKYRTALVLCYLEGKTHAEAADLLGCPLATIRTRVARGRKLLRQQLTGHGLNLSAAALAALLLASAAPAATPASLTGATLKAALPFAAGQAAKTLCSAAVAGLVEGGLKTMSLGKMKGMLILVVAAGILAGAAALAHGVLAVGQPPAPSNTQPPGREGPPMAKAAEPGEVEVAGKVLAPDGKPVASARLYWVRLLHNPPQSDEDLAWDRKAVTAADGTFRLKVSHAGLPPDARVPLVAAADGFGVDWADVPRNGGNVEKTLRLVKDVPIRGRLLDTQGKPLAGARVRVGTILSPDDDKLDAFLTGWKQSWQDARHVRKTLYAPLEGVLPVVTTDKEGRFELTGAGAERVVLLEVRGPSTSKATLYVVSRPGLDPRPINAAVLDRIPAAARIPGQPPLLYGCTFDYVAGPARIVEGTVREADTGKPLAGISVHALGEYPGGSFTRTDAKGHYLLSGLPKGKEYSIYAEPPKGGSLLARLVRPADDGGLGPLQCDIELARGVVVTGRLIDRATGKGVKGGIRYAPLADNKYFGKKPGYDSYRYERFTHDVDAQGRFRLVVLPGTGVLMAQAYPDGPKINGVLIKPYKQAEFDAADRERVKVVENGHHRHYQAAGNSLEFLSSENAAKVLDLAEGAPPTTCDLFVERGTTLKVRVQDPDGKSLPGVIVSGMTASYPTTFTLEGAECTAYALDPKRPRELMFLHPTRKLAGTLKLRGDEKEPATVKLVPTGALKGRVLDQEGQPVAGAEVRFSYEGEVGDELFRHLKPPREPARTDADGRFRLEGLIPDAKFGLGISKGKTFLVGEPRIGLREVKSSATLDLGDVRTKPGN
jgi:RNA polymerase sigma factor (sigma-70 family)